MRDTDEAITVKQACRILGGDEAPIAPAPIIEASRLDAIPHRDALGQIPPAFQKMPCWLFAIVP